MARSGRVELTSYEAPAALRALLGGLRKVTCRLLARNLTIIPWLFVREALIKATPYSPLTLS